MSKCLPFKGQRWEQWYHYIHITLCLCCPDFLPSVLESSVNKSTASTVAICGWHTMFTVAYLCGWFCSQTWEGVSMFAAVLSHTKIQCCKQLSLNPFSKEQLQMAFLSHICNSSAFVIPEATSVHTIFRLCCKHRYGAIPQLSICPIERMLQTKVHD